jgi:hypothetical protein|tara:strand:+ start:348 stop:1169 length:822 start_codon:yes stop_codon:yes gene_type:complete
MKKIWSAEEDRKLFELKEQEVVSREIARILTEEFGHVKPRTRSSVDSRYHILRKEGISHSESEDKDSSPSYDSADYSLSRALTRYDEKHLKQALTSREDFLYTEMAKQAKQIRDYDFHEEYGDISIRELKELGEDEIQKAIEILNSQGEMLDINEIGLLVRFPFESNNKFSVVLPVTLADSKKTSKKGLVSCLRDSFLGAARRNFGFSFSGKGTEDRFRDLVRYNLKGDVDSSNYGAMGNTLTEYVQSEHPSIKKVYFFDSRINQDLLAKKQS